MTYISGSKDQIEIRIKNFDGNQFSINTLGKKNTLNQLVD